MKMLLDENLPKKLRSCFDNCEAYTVREMEWQGKKNGELLALMIKNDFDLLLTFDKNMRHQQNFQTYPIAVFVLNAPSNDYKTLEPLCPKIKQLIEENQLLPGVLEITLSPDE